MKLFEDGDPFFAPMLNALFAAFRGTAVMSGCEVSATGTSRTVSITAGSVQINGEVIAVSAGSVTLDAGSTFDRYDLVSVNASGSKIVTKGTTKRKCPTQPANTCLLAIVFVPAGATVIATGNVYDARMDAMRLSVLNINADKLTLTSAAHEALKIIYPSDNIIASSDAPHTISGEVWVVAKAATIAHNGTLRIQHTQCATDGGLAQPIETRICCDGEVRATYRSTRDQGPKTYVTDVIVRAGSVVTIEGNSYAGYISDVKYMGSAGVIPLGTVPLTITVTQD